MGNEDDELLVRSVREPGALAPLVPRLSPVLHGYLARRAGSVADDLLGDVWVEAFAARITFDPARGTARAWMFGIARHVLHRHLAATSRSPAGRMGRS